MAWNKSYLMVMAGVVAAAGMSAAARAEGPGPRSLTLEPLNLPESTEQWIDSVKKPAKGLSWGADERLRWEYFNNAITLNGQKPGHEWDFGRFRTRVWGDYSPCKEFELYTRLTWEWRYWIAPDSKPSEQWNYAVFDNLYARVKPLPELTVTVGRQDMIFGDGWLILEGTPLDGSTTIYFDAARVTYDAKAWNTKFDAVFIQQFSRVDMWLPAMGDSDAAQIEQDERGAILYVTNKSIQNTQVDAYFIYKNDHRRLGNGDQGDIYTPGVRIAPQFTENLKGRVEVAGQWGERNGASLCAWGLNSRLTWAFNDAYKNELFVSYEFLSGDDPKTARNEAFDPLWGRWPQWSELYVYSYAQETRIAETTNLQRIGPGWNVSPMKNVDLQFTYHALFANENTRAGTAGFSNTGLFRGQLMTAIAKWKINKHISSHLWGEFFLPGNYYDNSKGDSAVYLRAEVVLTF